MLGFKPKYLGSIPRTPANTSVYVVSTLKSTVLLIAQLVDFLFVKQEVTGATPVYYTVSSVGDIWSNVNTPGFEPVNVG